MRKLIRRLLMFHPGYRKAHFVGLEVQELRRELVGLLEGNESRVKEAIVAAKPTDRTDELKEAIAAAKPADRTDELKEAIAAAKPADRTDELKEAIAAAKPADRTDELKAIADRNLHEYHEHLDNLAETLGAGSKDRADRVLHEVHEHLDNLAETLGAGSMERTDRVLHEVHEHLNNAQAEIQSIADRNFHEYHEHLNNAHDELKTLIDGLFKNDIRCRWQVLDALDGLLFPPATPVKCLVCGHEAPKSTYETRISECIFGGGRLERFVCPECGCVFGPLKMMALTPNQLAAEYVQNYSVYRETDCTFLERPTFMALKPTKNGVYLNYGAGAWNHTTVELREAGYTVYDFEPYAPTGDRPWVIRSKDELGKMKFDGIFSNDLIEHFQHPVESLLEMKKLLKPGGVMAHTTGCYDYEYEYTRFHYAFFLGKSLSILSNRIGMAHHLQTSRLDPHVPSRLCLFSK